MKHHSTIFAALLVLFGSLISPSNLMAKTPDITSPDFAFPAKVRKDATLRYETAMRQGNDIDALRALVDAALAETSIAPDSAGNQADAIEKFAKKCKNEAVASLAYLFCAKAYNDIYTANRWNFDQRTLPLLPMDENIQAWSGEQFRYKINSLCDSATAQLKSIMNVPVADYKPLVTVPSDARPFFPTVADFVVSDVIELKTSMLNGNDQLPIGVLSDSATPVALKKIRPEIYAILSLYDKLIDNSRNSTAPYLYWTVEKLDFIRSRIYYNEDDARDTKYKNILKTLFKKFSGSQYCTLPLNALAVESDGDNIDEAKEIYGYIKSTIAKYPNAPLANCLKNALGQKGRKSIEVMHNRFLTPGGTLEVKISSRNTPTAHLTLYRLPDNFTDLNNYVRLGAGAVKTDSKTVNFSGEVPFIGSDTIGFAIDRPGRYIIVPSFSGASNNRESYPVINVSALTAGAFNGEEHKIVVVEPVSGAPVSDSEIIGFKWKGNVAETKSLGKTDSNGFTVIPSNFSGTIRPVKGADRFAGPMYVYENYDSRSSRNVTFSFINLFCDLPIYHPGDSVNWACVAYSAFGEKKEVMAGKAINVVFMDANRTPLDTTTVTTDALGRASGTFYIPEGLLTGRFTIQAKAAEKQLNAQGYMSVMVSDYKLPTYILEDLKVENDTPAKGSTTFTGIAKTFSGVPLAGISVKMDVASLPNWWRAAGSSEKFYSAETATDAAGRFTFIVTKPDYELAPNTAGAFSASFNATSATGESATAQKVFTLGTKYHIIATIPADLNISSPVRLNAYASDAEGLPVKEPVIFSVMSGTDTVLRGEIENGKPVDLSALPSGIYTFIFDADNAAPEGIRNIAVYRPDDPMPPRKSTLWIPEKSVTDGSTLLVGTSNKTTNVLYTIVHKDKILKQEWLAYSPGMHKLKVNLPDNAEDAYLWLFSLADYKSTTERIKIEPRRPSNDISITTETWRDRLIPGSQETITFKIKGDDSTGVKAAMMLDMFNAALKTFGNHSLDFHPRTGYIPTMDFNAPRAFSNSYTNLFSPFSYLTCTYILTPELNTYNRSFNPIRIRGGAMRLYGARSMANGIETSEDEAEAPAEMVLQESIVVQEHKAMAAVATADMAKEESIEAEADAGSSEEGGNTGNFEYRDSEVPLAFFAPVLTTDEYGNLSYSFTVPNANTTWILSAMAYTSDLRTASLNRSAIASKPIMVAPNLPRFVRTGDVIVIESQIFNTTETTASAKTEVHIINPANGEILQSETYTSEIGANGSATVCTKVAAPFDIPFICFRIKSSTEGFSDGEQALIPVLPSSTPVIESTEFYVPSGTDTYTVNLPKYNPDSRVTFTYCDNPVWYVVTALPGLSQRTLDSAPEAARRIFSAAVAKGLVNRYPQIASALKEWSNNPADSTLTDMLERNADMKSLLLAATPWMQQAESDTERMMRLVPLLDAKECDNAINEAVDCIEKLQNGNGGISWIGQYKVPSLWATSSVLATIGKLNTLGFMPDNARLKKICDKALNYTQKEYSDIYMRSPKSSFSTFATIASLWKDFKPSTIGRSMISVETQKIVKNWKNMCIAEKANAALLLYRTGNPATARTILASLDEYATVSETRGMWWQPLADRSPSLATISATATALTAYATIAPGSPQIEKITQWLILQKQSMDWGTSPAATEIISAVLTSAPKWIARAGKTEVKLGRQILTDEASAYTGEMKINLNPEKASKSHLNIIRSGNTPAWGGVASFDTRSMENVQATSCSNLSITKQFVVADGNGWTTRDTLKVGDKVKITLTIKSETTIDYLAITDRRAACFEPVEQKPTPVWSDGICFYRENRDSQTNIFVNRLPKGTFVIEYEMWVNNAGTFASGIATAQSQYAPEITAHSAGNQVTVTR